MDKSFAWIQGSASGQGSDIKATVVHVSTRQAICECYTEDVAEQLAHLLNSVALPEPKIAVVPDNNGTLH